MGYEASGSVTVQITEDQATQIALSIDSYPGELDTLGGDIILRMLGGAYYDEPDLTLKDGIYTYNAYYNSKWYEEINEAPLHFLASHGAQIKASFRGEDEETWLYRTEAGENKLIYDYITDVPHTEYVKLMKALISLNQLQTELEKDPNRVYTAEDILNIMSEEQKEN